MILRLSGIIKVNMVFVGTISLKSAIISTWSVIAKPHQFVEASKLCKKRRLSPSKTIIIISRNWNRSHSWRILFPANPKVVGSILVYAFHCSIVVASKIC